MDLSFSDLNPSIVTIGTVKPVKTFFLSFPALNSTAMSKKLKYSNLYPIRTKINNCFLKAPVVAEKETDA